MPVTKSVHKNVRQSARRRVRNIQRKKKMRNAIKDFKNAVEAKDFEKAKNLLPKVYKTLDKTSKAKTIKKGTASRMKSRLTKKLSVANK